MRGDVWFESEGLRIGAWWYRGGDGRRPCIVMAHGFAGTRRSGLASFAERFQAAGFHALVFDYRHFGDSEGEPRQLLSPRAQVKDWASAIAYARGRDDVDEARVALWGTSFSGGLVVIAGARDGRVAAITAQCPLMDGLAALIRVRRYAGTLRLLRTGSDALVDVVRDWLGRPPHVIPVVGPPGSRAAMSTPDAEPGYLGIAGPDFENTVCARIGLSLGLHRPIRDAARLPCPILVQICEHDAVAPVASAERAAALAGHQATVVRYPLGHFDVYRGPGFEASVADQLAFFQKQLSQSPEGETRKWHQA
jgi:uncharacterized protein